MENKNILRKLANIKSGFGYMKTDGKGYNYNYVTPEALYLKFNELANKEGVLLLPSIVSKNMIMSENLKANNMVDIDMIMTFYDVESGEFISLPWASYGTNSNEKGFGSAITYGMRYFILSSFQIPTGDDDPDKYVKKPEVIIPAYIKSMLHTLNDIDVSFTESVKDSIIPLSEPKAVAFMIKSVSEYLTFLVKENTISKDAVLNAISSNKIEKISEASYAQALDILQKSINSMGR